MGTKKKDVKEAPIDTENFEYVAIPPDGGFGWVIAIAAMVKFFLLFFHDYFFGT